MRKKNGEFSDFSESLRNKKHISDPTERVIGINESHRTWCNINRIRKGDWRCGSTLFKWNMKASPDCDCGPTKQTTNHIVNDCTLRFYGLICVT